jgi:hypothetical protein
MTLKVGEVYQATFAGDLARLRITKILLDQDSRATIFYRTVQFPKWLWFLERGNECDDETFIAKIDEAKKILARVPPRSVSQVEVGYR